MRLIGGTASHFDQVVRAYSGELYHFALWLCRDRHRAEDVLQEALTRAWRRWGDVKDEAARKSWLYAIVRNEYFREAGKGRRQELAMDDEALAQIPDERDFTRGLEVRQLLMKLPAAVIEPLMLQNVGGMSCEEVAAVLGITVGAAMTRLSRARTLLRKLAKGSEPAAAIAEESLP
jgi:RNA polymerase sigma-70 factor (ECF subfamily)